MKKISSNCNIRGKIYAFLLPSIAFACLALSWFFYNDIRNHILEQMTSNIQNSALQAETKILNHLKTSQADTEFFSTNDAVVNHLSAVGFKDSTESSLTTVKNFRQLQTTKPEYREFYILDKEGELVFSHADDMFYIPEKDLIWINKLYNESLKKNLFSAKFIITESQSGSRLATLSPIKNKDNEVGFSIITQDLRAFSAMAFEFAPNGDGSVFYYSKSGILLNKKGGTEPAVRAIEPGIVEKKKTQNAIHHLYKLESIFGSVIVDLDATAHYKKLEKLKIQTGLITLAVTLIFSVLIWWLVDRLFIRPLKAVGTTADEISNGTYSQNPFKGREDEIGHLAQTLDDMSNNMKESNKKITKLAYHDDLTSLYNKQAFLEKAKTIKSKDNELITVWVLDIHDFKQINDIHGYDIGNAVLSLIGERLRNTVQEFCSRHSIEEKNFLAARSSGVEFLILASIHHKANFAEAFARHVLSNISAPISIQGNSFRITGNIGLHQGRNSGMNIYQKADMAMHEGRSKKLDFQPFEDSLMDRLKRNQKMSSDIKRTLDMNDFSLHYQPKCNTSFPNKMVGFEALIRWETPDGFISPSIFIPFAEDANLIKDIDYWVCKKVIEDVAQLESLGWRDFVVSFNVSGPRISDPNFIDMMRKSIKDNGVNPAHMQVEITEHSLIDDMKDGIDSIEKLREIGISTALDDFGTGHSSLGYLQYLPLNALKIDRCFIQNVNLDKNKMILLKHIIAIGQDLGLYMVAEGVETKEELAVLQEYNCDLIQGYIFHKPMPLDEAISKYEKERNNIYCVAS